MKRAGGVGGKRCAGPEPHCSLGTVRAATPHRYPDNRVAYALRAGTVWICPARIATPTTLLDPSFNEGSTTPHALPTTLSHVREMRYAAEVPTHIASLATVAPHICLARVLDRTRRLHLTPPPPGAPLPP